LNPAPFNRRRCHPCPLSTVNERVEEWHQLQLIGERCKSGGWSSIRGGRGQGLDGHKRRARKARKAFRKATREASAPVEDDASGWRGRKRNEEGQL
jgi:hypothetical protein